MSFMYDDEEEIKKKRRKLIITIAIIIIVIILLLIFLLSYGKGGKKKVEVKNPTCELEVITGTIGADGVYNSAVVVGIKNEPQSDNQVQIIEKKVGVAEKETNKETFTINKKGIFKVYGYVKDANGNKGTCSIEIEVNPSKPTCELEVKSGTLGTNEWYKSDVVVRFKSKESNSETATIIKYYIEKKVSELESDEVIRAEQPTGNIDEYTVKDNLTTQLFGYVIDSNGNEGTCSITVKKDTDLPTCKLKAINGTMNSSGLYTTDVTVGFETTTDQTSDIAEKGVGLSKNYKEETVAVTAPGSTVVYGYVKDNAGNEGTCRITINRPTPTTTTPTPTPTPTVSHPSCTLKIAGTLSGDHYNGATTVLFNTKNTTNGAKITSAGIGNTAQLNSNDSIKISTSGTHTIYGMVKDSYGNTATCSVTLKVTMEDNTLAKKVSVGDLVDYNAGTWENTVVIDEDEPKNGQFYGYTKGKNRKTGVVCTSGDTARSGWIVLSVSNGKVTLVHAGIPECYYHGLNADSTAAVEKINSRAATYNDHNYAESVRIFNKTDADAMSKSARNIDAYYYLATKNNAGTLWAVRNNNYNLGGDLAARSGNYGGIRPVVTLKANVKTTGRGNNGWVLSW